MKVMTKTHWLRITVCVLAACCVAGLVLALVLFNANPGRTSANSSIEFSFKDAASGLAPNGNRYDLSGFTNEDVLNGALEDAGLAGKYTADQVRANLVVSGVYPKNIVEQMTRYESLLEGISGEVSALDYHATLYSVTLYNDFDKSIPQDQLTGLLDAVMARFRAFFERTYSVSLAADTGTENLSVYDYPQQLDLLRESIDQKQRFAREMAEEHPEFLVNRKGFDDIVVRYAALLSGDLERISGIVTMNALSKNPDRVVAQYENEIRVLGYRLKELNAEASAVDELTKKYNKDDIIYVSTSSALQQVASNATATYDTLVARRKAIAEEIAELNKKLAQTRLKLSDIQGPQAPAAAEGEAGETADPAAAAPALSDEEREKQQAAVDRNIAALLAKRDAVTADFAALLKDYSESQMNDTTVAVKEAKYNAPKILSGAFAKQVVKTAGPLCAAGLMVCLVLLIISRRREQRS